MTKDEIMEAIDDYVKDQIDNIGTDITIPCMYWPKGDGWNDEPQDDPLAIYLLVRPDENADYSINGTVNLEEEIDNFLGELDENDHSYGEGARRFAKALRRLADKIDTHYDSKNTEMHHDENEDT